jgi:hypothetical protein
VTPLGFKIKRKRSGKGGEISYEDHYQSLFGFVFTAMGILFSVSYLAFLLYRMQTLRDERFSSQKMINLAETDGVRYLNLSQKEFIPILKISGEFDQQRFKIFNKTENGQRIDFTELQRYIVP